MFNFLKAARDPETASPGAEDPGAGRAGDPSQSLPVPATPASGWGRQGLSPPLRCPPRMEAGQVPRALPKALKSKIIAIEASGAEIQLGNTRCPNLGRGASRPAAPRLLGWWPRLGSAKLDGGRRQGAQLCEPGQGLARQGGRAAEAVSLPAEPSSAPPTEPTEPTSRSRCRQRLSTLVQSTAPAVRSP